MRKMIAMTDVIDDQVAVVIQLRAILQVGTYTELFIKTVYLQMIN